MSTLEHGKRISEQIILAQQIGLEMQKVGKEVASEIAYEIAKVSAVPSEVTVKELKREVEITQFPHIFEEWTKYGTDLKTNEWVKVLGGGVTWGRYQVMGFMVTTKSPQCQFALYTRDRGAIHLYPDYRVFQTISIAFYYEMLGTGYYKPICIPKYDDANKNYTLLVDLKDFMGDKVFEEDLYLQAYANINFPTEDLAGGCRKAVLWFKKIPTE